MCERGDSHRGGVEPMVNTPERDILPSWSYVVYDTGETKTIAIRRETEGARVDVVFDQQGACAQETVVTTDTGKYYLLREGVLFVPHKRTENHARKMVPTFLPKRFNTSKNTTDKVVVIGCPLQTEWAYRTCAGYDSAHDGDGGGVVQRVEQICERGVTGFDFWGVDVIWSDQQRDPFTELATSMKDSPELNGLCVVN